LGVNISICFVSGILQERSRLLYTNLGIMARLAEVTENQTNARCERSKPGASGSQVFLTAFYPALCPFCHPLPLGSLHSQQ